jgi:hypothetical protein
MRIAPDDPTDVDRLLRAKEYVERAGVT